MRAGGNCTRGVVYCGPDTGVFEIARPMRSRHVGDLVVAERGRAGLAPVGVVTDLARIPPAQDAVERAVAPPMKD